MKSLIILILLNFIGNSFAQTGIFFTDSVDLPEPECIAHNGRIGKCKILAKCPTLFNEIEKASGAPCEITADRNGVCCTEILIVPSDPLQLLDSPLELRPPPAIALTDITSNRIDDACNKSVDIQLEKEKFQQDLAANNIVAPEGSPVFWHARLFETSDEIFKLSKDANTILDATVALRTSFNLNKIEAENGLNQFNVSESIIKDRCPPDPVCPDPNYNYRTIDGTCNNAQHLEWGKTGISFRRMIPAFYEDGVQEPRIAVNGGPLPSARKVSAEVALFRDNSYAELTILIWQWGQFLDHDLTHTPISKGINKDVDVMCCSEDGQHIPMTKKDPACFEIDIPTDDRFFSLHNQTCMTFVRSAPAIRPSCKFGPREQINQITSYLDGSNVYGSTVESMRKLRSFTGGLLKVTSQGDRDLLPAAPGEGACKHRGTKKCFTAGDSRVNEQPDLAVMHTIFMRQHNKIVESLAQINPHWDDEILFQEGRRIVAAQLQHITYDEYLPIVLGAKFMAAYGLQPLKEGFFGGYRKDVDATMTNVFATAAFRYGHTLITDDLKGFDSNRTRHEKLEVSKTAFVPFSLYDPDVLDNLIRGLSLQNSQQFDRFFSNQLTEKLFAQNHTFGMDLVALNVQRGRDHGLPPYVQWRKDCQLPPVNNWNDIAAFMKPDVVSSLSRIYDSVEDIDLFIGATSEEIVENTLVGPTIHCILGRQFISLKIGDRFYYENGNLRHPTLSQFTEGQLDEIRKTTLSRILCDNSDNIELMQPLAFAKSRLANEQASCESDEIIPRINLRPWTNSRIWVK